MGSFSYTSHAGFFILIWGVSLTHPMLVVSGEFLLHIPYWLHFYVGKFLLQIPCWLHFYLGCFSYTSHAHVIFIWGVSLIYPLLALIWSADFLLHIPCRLHFYLGSFPYTSHAGFTVLLGVSLTHPILASFSFFFNLGSFSYTPRGDFIFMWVASLTHPMLTVFMWGVSLTHPMLLSFLCGVFLLHIACWPYYYYYLSGEFLLQTGAFFFSFYRGSLSYTSRAGFIFMWGISLTHSMLASFLSGEYPLHIPSCLNLISWVSLTHPELDLIWSAEFLWYISCWFHFYWSSLSYTSRAGFIFMWGVSLTHPMLASFLCWEVFLHIPFCLDFYARSFSEASRAGYFSSSSFLFFFLFIWGVSLTHPVLVYVILSGEFYFYPGSFPCTSQASLIFIWGICYTSRDGFIFYLGSLSYASHASFNLISGLCLTHFHAGFIFIGVISLTHLVLASFLCAEFPLHIRWWLPFYAGIFSYISRAGFTFIWVVSLTHRMLAFFLFL